MEIYIKNCAVEDIFPDVFRKFSVMSLQALLFTE